MFTDSIRLVEHNYGTVRLMGDAKTKTVGSILRALASTKISREDLIKLELLYFREHLQFSRNSELYSDLSYFRTGFADWLFSR